LTDLDAEVKRKIPIATAVSQILSSVAAQELIGRIFNALNFDDILTTFFTIQ
jgi:hypothetical protein